MYLPRTLLQPGAGQAGAFSGTLRRAVALPSPFTSRALFSAARSSSSSSISSISSSPRPAPVSVYMSLLCQQSKRRPSVSNISTRFASTARAAPPKLPERVLIFHAGTPRTTFLACLKVTTLFGLAFFTFLVAPAYIAADKPLSHILAIVACGVVPFSLIAYTSQPFVVFIHLRLPAFARHPDPELLRRFVRNIPAGTKLDITTMNLVGRPRVTSVPVGDIVPAHERFGIVNFVDSRQSVLAPPATAPGARHSPSRVAPAPPATQRPQTKLVAFSSTFPWIHLRQTTHFGAPPGNNSRGVKNGWAWEELLAVIERRATQQPKGIETKSDAAPF